MVKRMSEIELQISSIKNLDMVNFYHLFDDGKSLPGMLAYYDSTKVINLCAADKGFPMLLDKIVEVYSLEKQYGRIVLDYNTKQVLDRSISCSKSNYENMLAGFLETAKPIYLDKAYIHIIVLPLVKYIIDGIYGVNDMTVNWNIYNKSWYGRGVLTASVNEKATKFPYLIARQNDKMHRAIINGLLRPDNTLTIDIIHDLRGIGVTFKDNLYGYEGSLSADVSGDVPMLKFEILSAGERVFFNESAIPESNAEEGRVAIGLSLAEAEFKEYILPWGETISLSKSGGKMQCIFSAGDVSDRISLGICSERLDDRTRTPIDLGLFAYILFESVAMKELHFLDMGYPQQALYKEEYAGKSYTLKKGEHHGN